MLFFYQIKVDFEKSVGVGGGGGGESKEIFIADCHSNRKIDGNL